MRLLRSCENYSKSKYYYSKEANFYTKAVCDFKNLVYM